MTTLSTDWKLLNDKTVSYGPWSGKFKLYAKIVSTDIANNRTKVAYDWDFETTAGYSASSYDAQDYVTAAGWNSAEYRTYSGSGNLRHGEEWITHNADGTKSSSCSGRTRMGGIGVDTDWVSASFDLPRIPRASVPTCSPNPLTIGSSGATLTVNTNRKASSFTHTIKVQCGSWSWTSSARAVGASVNVSIPYSVIAQFSATSKTATATITCTTFSGTTQIGSAQTCSCTFQINTSVDHPNVGTATFTEGNERVAAIVNTPNTFVQGISTLVMSVPITASGSYTQLAKATVSNGSDNRTYTLSGTSGTVSYTSVNNRTTWLTITAYDKRGTTAVSKPSWTLLPYAPLTVTGTVGRTSATGSVAVGQVSGVAYGGDYGQSTNSLTISYRYKEHDSSTWIDGAETFTKSLNNGQQTYTQAMTFSEAFDYQKQYDVEFSVSDLFSTATYTAQLMQGLPILSWDETEVDVWGSLHIHDRDNPTSWQDVMEGFDGVLASGGQKNFVSLVAPTKTENGVTFTHSGSYYNINGTASADAFCNATAAPLETGRQYILSGMHDEWVQGIEICVRYVDRVTIIATATRDDVVFTCPAPCFPYVVVHSGTTVSNKKWYPMVRDARIASSTFARFDPTPCFEIALSKAISNISSVEFAFVTVIGRLCIANFNFTVSSAITNNTAILFTGLPPANRTYRTSLGGVDGTKQIRVMVNSVGSLQNSWTSGGIAAGQYEGQIVYVMQ